MATNAVLIAVIYLLSFGLIFITIISFVLSIVIAIFVNKDIKTNKKTHL
ncbi:MAG: hypothetical protein HFJ17_03920 [Clostridia bacterium]|nr:hypothetical protein [Clostridia bacterium]